MSQEEEEEGGAASQATQRRTRTSPLPPKRGSSRSEANLTALSHADRLPKWSFSKADRFPHGKKSAGLTARSQSSVALSATTAATDGHHEEQAGHDPLSASPGGSTWAGFSRQSFDTKASTVGFGAYDTSSPVLLNTGRAPRLDGTLDRFLDAPERAANPRPKAYDPAETMGVLAVPSVQHAPRWSFGGGKTRMATSNKPLSAKLAASDDFAATFSPGKEKQNLATIQKLEMQSTSNSLSLREKASKKLSRGFGTAARLPKRGGALDMPPSPGPAAYAIMRDSDPAPDWLSAKILPWGVRSAGRPELKNPTQTDVAPGEHTANHPFQAAGPTCLFGQRLNELAPDGIDFPEPNRYNIKTSMGTGVSAPIGPGQRAKWGDANRSPGPAQYYPKTTTIDPEPQHAVFGEGMRVHEADFVDPDEPPGPGSHLLPSTLARGSVGLPKDVKLRKVPGLGPEGPGPGQYQPTLGEGKASPISFPLHRGVEPIPGPGSYDPDDHVGRTAPPVHRPLHYTNPRKSPFAEVPTGKANAAEAMRRRAAAAAREESDQLGYTKLAAAKALEFQRGVKTSSSWSLGARRPMGGGARPDDCEARMIGTVTSFG